jgi:tRNA (mo5U34)-methyltransferase
VSAPVSDPSMASKEKLTVEQLRAAVMGREWFHKIELGNGITTPGFDASAQKLVGIRMPESCIGMSVLDIGALDGFFSFEAERRGAARVVACDHYCWSGTGRHDKGGFDLAKRALRSHVEEHFARVEDLDPAQIGTFDLVLFLGVLYHAPDPLGYLTKVRSLCHGTAIIETHVDALEVARPALVFYPGASLNNDPTNFFGPNPLAVEAMLKEVGFRSVEAFPQWAPSRQAFHAYS